MKQLRERLASGLPCVGGWLGTSSPLIAEAMASCGFHWVAADMEHGQIGVADLPALFAACQLRGAAPLVRLPGHDPILARRCLDAGALGLIVPVVQSASAFADFATHCLYPPAGRRGVSLCRANGWGDSFQDYLGFRPLLVPQIETAAGAAAALDIARLDVVDALFLGPYDLSADLGHPGDFNHSDVVVAMDRVRSACLQAGKPSGIHQVAPDPAQLQARIAEGYRFVAYSTDIVALRAALGNPTTIVESALSS